ncbi:MAG: high-potential iron-sulfur protein, partial [Comamonadaceae bacterium]
MMQTAVATSATLLAVNAQAQSMVAETDPQAATLGYKADASKVDKTKQPKFAAGQACSSCALYQGPALGRARNC